MMPVILGTWEVDDQEDGDFRPPSQPTAGQGGTSLSPQTKQEAEIRRITVLSQVHAKEVCKSPSQQKKAGRGSGHLSSQ
jgi:hypothetical protein